MLNYQERDSLIVGQKVFLYYSGWGRNNKGRYTRPLDIIKVTATQFTVEGENDDSKPKRFMKSNGREIGSGYSRNSPSVSLVTKSSTKTVDQFNEERMIDEKRQDAEARATEVALREKYNAVTIIDEKIQKEFLAPLREMAENGEKEMQDFLDSFKDVTVVDENFYRVNDAVEREARDGGFSYGQSIRDYAMNLHEQLSHKALAFARGTRYRVGKIEITKLDDLLYTVVRETLNQQLDRFFGGSHSQDITTGDQTFIRVLREIMRDTYAYDRIKCIADDEEV